jgi:type I restriction enzyme S subunit
VERATSLRTDVKYKKTPIGKIPVDWEAVGLNRIGALKGGNGFPEKYQGHAGLKYLFIKVSDMNLPGNDIYINKSINTIDEEIRRMVKCDIFKKDTIVFAKVGAALLLNRRRMLTRESAIDNNMMGFVVGGGNDPKFYYYVLQAVDFANYFFPGALPSLNQRILGNIDVVCPPLSEQKKIAEILTVVDEAIEKTSQVIEKGKEIQKGLMQTLLTRGIGHKKFKKTEIGEIPEEWEVCKMKDVVLNDKNSIKSGPFGSTLKKSTFVERGYKVYGQEQVISDDFSLGDYYISEEKFNELKDFEVKPNDLLVSLVGTFGKVSVVPRNIQKGIINPRLIKMSPNPEMIVSEFLKYLLSSDLLQGQMKKYTHGGTMGILNTKIIRSLVFPVPPIQEQTSISKLLHEIDAEIQRETDYRNHIEALKKSVMQVLLTGKVRVTV